MTQETQETKPEALRLADDLDAFHTRSIHREAAAELRRQHAEIERIKACIKELELIKHLRDGLAAEMPRDDILTLAQDAHDYLDDAEEIDQGRALSIARGMMQDMAKAIFQLVAQNKAAGAQEGELCMLYALEQAECRKLRAERESMALLYDEIGNINKKLINEIAALRRLLTQKK